MPKIGQDKSIGKDTRFGTGQDPTKGGAPKGKRISTILKELLEKNTSEIGLKGLPDDMDGNKAIALELLTIAFSKDSKDKLSAIKEVLDRLEGKAVQKIDADVKKTKVITGITFKDEPEADIS